MAATALLRSIRRRDVVSAPLSVYKSLAANTQGSSYTGQTYASLCRAFGSNPHCTGLGSSLKNTTETKIVGAELKTKSFRPLSPHLPVYQPQMNSMLSIFNRISGVYLTGVSFAGYLLYLKMGMICLTYPSFYQVLYHTQQQLPVITSVTAFVAIYHTIKSTHSLWTHSISLLTRVPKVQGGGIFTQNKIGKLWESLASSRFAKVFEKKLYVKIVDSIFFVVGSIVVITIGKVSDFGIPTKQCAAVALEVKKLRKDVDELLGKAEGSGQV